MEDRELIEQALKNEGLVADDWRDGDDGKEAVIGRWRVVEDDENEGLFADDEGELIACVVGAPAFGNQRVVFYITPEGYDTPMECRPFDNVEPIV